jgi:hypothetical protein
VWRRNGEVDQVGQRIFTDTCSRPIAGALQPRAERQGWRGRRDEPLSERTDALDIETVCEKVEVVEAETLVLSG